MIFSIPFGFYIIVKSKYTVKHIGGHLGFCGKRCKQRPVRHIIICLAVSFSLFNTNFRVFMVDCNLNNIILVLNEYTIMYFIVNMCLKVTCLCID